jgi:hypothetical protein
VETSGGGTRGGGATWVDLGVKGGVQSGFRIVSHKQESWHSICLVEVGGSFLFGGGSEVDRTESWLSSALEL